MVYITKYFNNTEYSNNIEYFNNSELLYNLKNKKLIKFKGFKNNGGGAVGSCIIGIICREPECDYC